MRYFAVSHCSLVMFIPPILCIKLNDYLADLSQQILANALSSEHSYEVTIGDIAIIIDCLHSKKPELLAEGKLFLQLENIRDDGILNLEKQFFISDKDYLHWTSRCEVREGDCVITNVGRIGAVSQIPWFLKAAMGRNMTCIRYKEGHPYPAFLITSLLSKPVRAEIEFNTDSGTILGALNVKNIPKLKLKILPENQMVVLESTLCAIRHKMELNSAESLKLGNLRDYLLPKLISGKVDMSSL